MNNSDKLIELLNNAFAKCYDNDKTLIKRNMEQASVARIFYYMQDLIYNDERFADFKMLDLDCEYNKNGIAPKRTTRRANGTRPDIILHERNTNDKNTLIVEFKSGSNRSSTDDYIKLEDFTKNCEYNYYLGAFVKLNREKPEITYFQNGEKVGGK